MFIERLTVIMYKYEMHLHSSLTSKCATSDSVEYVKRAVETGFAGMVLTNHFYRGNSAIDKSIPWCDFVEFYKRDWENAKEEGDKQDIDVIFGMEEGYGNGKECLIYGLTPKDFSECGDFPKMPIAEISAFVRSKGGFIACAHPFRNRGYITNPDLEPCAEYFDGVEVYNRGNSPEENIKAMEFAKKNNLICIGGGDTHSTSGFGAAGIILPQRVSGGKELVEMLKARKARLISGGLFTEGDLYE